MGSKHRYDKKRGLTKVSRTRSRNKTKWLHHVLFAAQYILSWSKMFGLDLQITSGI